jgi:ubiquinone/menaquinone biosynthesis C-methylase UbiE
MPNLDFFNWFFNSDTFTSSKASNKSEIWGYYDYFADEFCRLATSEARYKKLRQLFDVGRPLEIMKVGPATGTFLYVAQNHGHHAMGCDVSSEFVNYAQEHYDVQIDNGRFERMDYSDEQFDVIVLFNVIENIPNQEEFLEEVLRTLKNGGYFILNVVDMERNIIAKLQKSKYFLYRPPVTYIYTMNVLNKVLEKYGFKVVKQFRDIRYVHIEKIAALLRWKWLLSIARLARIHRIPFPIYMYPSKIVVAKK